MSPEAVWSDDVPLAHAVHVDVTGSRLHLQAAVGLVDRDVARGGANLALAAERPTSRSPEAVLTVSAPSTRAILTSPLAELTCASPPTCSNSTSPEAVFTCASPNSPRASTSAEAVETSTSAPAGVDHAQANLAAKARGTSRSVFSITTLSSCPSRLGRSSMRASSSISGRADELDDRLAPSTVSRSMSPLGTRMSSASGPGVRRSRASSLLPPPRRPRRPAVDANFGVSAWQWIELGRHLAPLLLSSGQSPGAVCRIAGPARPRPLTGRGRASCSRKRLHGPQPPRSTPSAPPGGAA